MPRRNRVTPFGEIIATPERGAFMGNRGILHDPEGHVRRAWKVKRWLVCALNFRGRQRTVHIAGPSDSDTAVGKVSARPAARAPAGMAAFTLT